MELFYQGQFIDEVGGACELVDNEKHITDIDVDCALHIGFEHDVAAHGFPVTVKGKADQLAVAVDDRAARVAPVMSFVVRKQVIISPFSP